MHLWKRFNLNLSVYQHLHVGVGPALVLEAVQLRVDVVLVHPAVFAPAAAGQRDPDAGGAVAGVGRTQNIRDLGR